jgi:1-phosphatidylinositol phosphodiesterase
MSRNYVLFVTWMVLAGCSGPDGPDGSEADWMADLADSRGVAELSIPGTHDSGALHEPYPGIAQAQRLAIADQLVAGVRYFDIRCRHVDDAFLIYHGPIDQDQTFDQVLATMSKFLDEHPGEALVVSVQEEPAPEGNTRSFEATFASYVAQAPDRWYLGDTLPRLGDVRGRLVLLRRFAATAAPLGLDGSGWANDATFSLTTAASLRIEDDYTVSDNAVKWAAITELLAEARSGDAATLFLGYTSGYQTIDELPSIPSVADDINARLDGFLADARNRNARLGVLAMDFVTAARARAILVTNTTAR